MIDLIRGLEDLKSLAAARQADAAVAFDLSQRREQADTGVAAGAPAQGSAGASAGASTGVAAGARDADGQGAGVAAQIALARRESPARGSRLLGLAQALTGMPHTSAAFRSGKLNEWRVTLLVKETICLTPEDRAGVDEELAADTGTLDGMGDKAITAAARAAAYRRDPATVATRATRAATERSVSLRPAPDTMTYLTALLPVAQGVAAYAALARDAGTALSSGDGRSRGQTMADTLVERLTGTPGGITGVEIQLVMTDRTLLQAHPEPARLPGYGIIPAATARALALTTPRSAPPPPERPARPTIRPKSAGRPRINSLATLGLATTARTQSATTPDPATGDEAGTDDLTLWIRRLYTAPGTGELLALDSRARLFPPGLKRFLQIRDNTCRTPYCDAPIRHHDHITAWHTGGPSAASNGQGLCEACNHTKEHPGWTASPSDGTRHTVATTTPTGHTYRSTPPPLPGTSFAGVQLPASDEDRDKGKIRDSTNSLGKDSRQACRTPRPRTPVGASARPPGGLPRPTVQVLGRVLQSGAT